MAYHLVCIPLFLFLTACSVYKSTGRDAFESNVPGNVNATSTALESAEPTPMIKNETCWNQPATDPLWNMDSNQGIGDKYTTELVVRKLTTTEIEVCSRPIDQ